MTSRRFGISTHLFHDHRLVRDHVVQIASHGFQTIELSAARSHFDYHDDDAIDALAGWLSESRLELHSMHAPTYETNEKGHRIGALSTASGDEGRRTAAVAAVRAALQVARRVPLRVLVVHLGVISDEASSSRDNRPDAARRSLEDIVGYASEVGVRVAIEVIPNALSEPEALVRLIEEDLEGIDVGVCLDFGHAHLMGDIGDAIETLSGHLWTTHVHDNRGQRDEHLAPFAGTIDWGRAIMETQKIGYDDVWMLELAGGHDPVGGLQRSMKARERLEQAFLTL